MRLPQLTELPCSKDNTEEFYGLNHNLRTAVGEWYDQKNMTCDYYPVASPRDKRSVQTYNDDISKMIGSQYISFKGCEALVYVDNQLIQLKNVFDENDVFIGDWFLNNKELVAVKSISDIYGVSCHPYNCIVFLVASQNKTMLTLSASEIDSNFANVGDTIRIFIDGYHRDFIVDTKNGNGITVYDKSSNGTSSYNYDYIRNRPVNAEFVITNITKNEDAYKEIQKEILRKVQSFKEGKHFIVRMGSYACVFPDGVVYETANKEVNIPVFNIEKSIENTGVLFETVVPNSLEETGYAVIDAIMQNENSPYRLSDGQIQYYIEDSGIWVNQKTYVKIYKTGTHLFDDFNVGDALKMVYNGSPQADMQYYGLFEWDAQSNQFVEKTLKILKKGTFSSDSNTDYIIVDGFVAGTYVSAGTHTSTTLSATDSLSLTRKMPDIAFACESQNRIWACSKDGHEIYASALGNPYNFYDYSGISTDSYAVNVGSDGLFTACFNYLGQPLFFKENTLHTITGSYPSNAGMIDGFSYAVSTLSNFKGVEKGSERSLAVIDNILYYKSSAGIVAYDGASTRVISYSLGKEKYKNAVAGTYNNKYYVSMQDSKGTYHLFTYDTTRGVWCKEDDIQVTNFIQIENELLFTTIDDVVYSVSDENVLNLEDYKKEDNFEWFCETGNYGYSYPNNKYLSRFQIRMQIADGAKASIYIQYNSDGIWHRKGEMQGKGIRTHLIPIVPVRCDHMKIKIAGKGDVKIYSITKIFEEGGDV